jgi:hypothetical protein
MITTMTVQLSPHKVSKILRGYFRGIPQVKIAKEAGVDQSSISHYASRFKEMAAEYNLLAAGKEYQVMNEVESLRSLSVELYKSKLTVDEARLGHNIIKAFLKLGISPEQHHNLVEVSHKVADPGFVEAALQLSQIEIQTGMSYQQVMSNFEKAQKQLPHLEKKLEKTGAELESDSVMLAQRKEELAKQEEYIQRYKEEVKGKMAQLEQELFARIQQLGLKEAEIEEGARLKIELGKQGLDLKTFLKLVKEYSHGSNKD